MPRAIFLDRDGVINKAIVRHGKPYPPHSLDELILEPYVLPSLNKLKENNFLLIAVTNQPDVARGELKQHTLDKIHQVLLSQLPLDEILVCMHDDADRCNCRKPKPGLLYSAAEKYHLDLTSCYMIGDRWRDIEAGKNANCKTIWINRSYVEKKPTNADFTTFSLCKAVDWIVSSCTR